MLDFIEKNDTELVFIVCAVLGGVMHYLKKFLKGETDVPIHDWFGRANLAATVYTSVVFLFAIIGAIAAEVINSATGFWAAMYTGFVTGFAIDSGFNSSKGPADGVIEAKGQMDQLFNKNQGYPGSHQLPRTNEPPVGDRGLGLEVSLGVDVPVHTTVPGPTKKRITVRTRS